MTAPARRSSTPLSRRLALRVAVGVLLTVVATYGPLAAAWLNPTLLGPPGSRAFSHQGRDFDVVANRGLLAMLGFDRTETTAIRSLQPINPPTTSARDRELAEQTLAADLRAFGPFTGEPFGRGGLILHRHRLGWPVACVEARVPHTFRGGEGMIGPFETGIQIAARSGTTPVRGLWLVPWGVLPLGLAINLAFWTALTAGPLVIRTRIAAARRKRGLCVACGYDLSGVRGAPCPECGSNPPQNS